MKLVIDIGEAFYDLIQDGLVTDSEQAIRAIKEGVLLPQNATNGDMIKAMFPNAYIEKTTNDGIVFIDNGGGVTHFNRDWWNAPYRTEQSNE